MHETFTKRIRLQDMDSLLTKATYIWIDFNIGVVYTKKSLEHDLNNS